ncbi:MAG TPA: ATP-binding protein [Verrucomicrobiae bacterium]|jgi:PAS domain S-box-containing protein|nr:ATP-binding protein [Verrucomicrobiae bacterium]
MKVVNKPDTSQESQNFFCVLQNCLAAGIIVVDGKNRVTTFTRQAENITGLAAEKVLNRDIRVLPTPLRKIIQSASTSGKTIEGQEIIVPSRDRGSHTLQVSAAPLHSRATKKKRGATIIVNDVTPARRLEETLRRLDRLASIGTLSASTAHEIKNALVAVKTFMDLLLEKHSDEDLAGIVRRELARIESIVGQLLRFAAPPRSAFSPIQLHEVVQHSLHTVQSQLIGKQIALQLNLNAAMDSVSGDDYQLQQAFVNLLLNGIEAMGVGGKLTVATEVVLQSMNGAGAPRKTVRLTIADSGSGIPAENLGRLFEPFFTTKKHGTGLGLSITQRIIEGHRGVINIESETGKGSAFHISFPLLAGT